MVNLRFRIARWVMAHRGLAWLFFVLATVFFAVGMLRVEIRTVFSDLLPKDDPFVRVFKDHRNFGNPLTVTIMVKRKSSSPGAARGGENDGTIYSAPTLAKVWQLTREVDLAPGVDHDQILSIATEKARYAEATPTGIDIRPLMDDHVPATKEEIDEFRSRVDRSAAARTFLISKDESATLINATFIEQRLDYGAVFKYVQSIVEKARDADHDVFMAGQPALTGWIYQYEGQMLWIAGITVGLLILCLVLYMRNIVGVVTPVVTSAVAAIWGFGFVGWLKSPIEPLLMVVPLLLVARSFSHCVQFTERYYEIYAHVKDRVKAAEITMGVMMAPSVLGIFTDIVGIFLIAVAPIPAMERFALFCGFWAIWLIPTGVFLISLLLASLPAPSKENVDRLIGKGKSGGLDHSFQALLRGTAKLSYGRLAPISAVIMAALAIGATYTFLQIKIGNPVEGSDLLWPIAEYNRGVATINQNFPGVNTLEIVLESKDQKQGNRLMHQADAILTMLRLQSLMEQGPNPPRATLSFGDYLMEGNRLFAGGNPKWLPLDNDDKAVNAAANAVLVGTSSKAYSNVIDFDQQNGTVSLWYKDNKQDTVDAALAAARKAVETVGADHPTFKVLLGSGTIALQQAMNNVVEHYHWIILGLLNLAIFLGCSFAYRSFIAGIILLIPVNCANFILGAGMHLIGIGLDINSLLVACVGVGVGIDYGIYLMSRICEEYHAHPGDWGKTITAALTTTGKAIMFTASIMVIGILPWYFLSSLKFMANMGLLLVLTMIINMVLALVMLPLLVYLVKPKFVSRTDLIVGEGVDLSAYTADDGEIYGDPKTTLAHS